MTKKGVAEGARISVTTESLAQSIPLTTIMATSVDLLYNWLAHCLRQLGSARCMNAEPVVICVATLWL
eukprot:3721545-Amphidinium_carterae.1